MADACGVATPVSFGPDGHKVITIGTPVLISQLLGIALGTRRRRRRSQRKERLRSLLLRRAARDSQRLQLC